MKNIFPAFFALLFIHAGAQNTRLYTRDSASISNAKKNVIDMFAIDSVANALPVPFSGFIVKDVRFDTAYIGVKIKNVPLSHDKTYEKTMLQKGTSAWLMNYLNEGSGGHFTPNNCMLACFVKELWIKQVDSVNAATKNKELYYHLSFEMETYLIKQNRYYPALRLDTAAVTLTMYKHKLPVLTDVLNAFVIKCGGIDTSRVFNRNAYTLAELENRYYKRFDKPILQAQQLQAGVYKTFSEFINNNPGVKQYQFKKDKKATILYTRTGGNDWLPERKAFGFCDGKVVWINAGNVFHPLVRQGNTFEFLANYYPETMANRGSSVYMGNSPLATLGGSLLMSGVNSLLEDDPSGKIVYQLNMENGEY